MNLSKNISWMHLFVIVAAAFIRVLDATFMKYIVKKRININMIREQLDAYVKEK